MSSRHRDDDYRRRHDERRRERRRSRSRSREHRRRDRSRKRDDSREKRRETSRDRRKHRNDSTRRRDDSRDRDSHRSHRKEMRYSRDRSKETRKEKTRERSRSIDKIISEDSRNSEYLTETLTEDQRQKVHEQMQARLQKLQKEQPKRIVPVRPSHATIFVNDGSFVEMFKQMQQQYQDQETTEPTPQERLKQSMPVFGRRRGGKILKTGIVEKKVAPSATVEPAKDAWSLYLQEVKRYKNATCDGDASRPLVK